MSRKAASIVVWYVAGFVIGLVLVLAIEAEKVLYRVFFAVDAKRGDWRDKKPAQILESRAHETTEMETMQDML